MAFGCLAIRVLQRISQQNYIKEKSKLLALVANGVCLRWNEYS